MVAGGGRAPSKKGPRKEESEYWKCGRIDHYKRNCPFLKPRVGKVSKEAAVESSLPATSECPETTKPWGNDR